MRWVLPLGIAIVAIISACGDHSGSSTPTPSVATSDSPTTSPSPFGTAGPTPTEAPLGIAMYQGPEADLPGETAVIIETGCWGCEGYAQGLVRIYAGRSGESFSQPLLSASLLNLPTHTMDTPDGPQEYQSFITGLAIEADASVMAVSFCVTRGCGVGGDSDWEPDSISEIFESMDGGVTWQEIGQGGPALSVVGVQGDGRVLTVNYTEELGDPHYAMLPDQTPVLPPAGASYPLSASGQILWATNDGRILFSDGSEFVHVPPGTYGDSSILGLAGTFSGLEKGSALVEWESGGPWYYHFGLIEISGGSAKISQILSTTNEGRLGWWDAKNGRAILSINPNASSSFAGGPVPAIFDTSNGEFRPIPGPFITTERPYRLYGRTIVDAVQTGPFARVTGTGSCLNIRAEASASGQVLTCAADGVLLRDTGQTSGDWVSVMTPGGTQGWASLSYLEH